MFMWGSVNHIEPYCEPVCPPVIRDKISSFSKGMKRGQAVFLPSLSFVNIGKQPKCIDALSPSTCVSISGITSIHTVFCPHAL